MRSFYMEQPTWLHRVPASAKLAAIAAAGTLLFLGDSLSVTITVAAIAGALAASLGPGTRRCFSALRGLLVVLALVVLFHSVTGSWERGVEAALRIAALFLLAVMLSLSTSFDALLGVAEAVLRPLHVFGLRPERLALALGLMLRFIEVFFLQWQRLDEAFRARSGRAGGVRILAPLAIQALGTALRVGEALSARLGR